MFGLDGTAFGTVGYFVELDSWGWLPPVELTFGIAEALSGEDAPFPHDRVQKES